MKEPMFDPSKIDRDCCTMCQKETPIDPEPPVIMTPYSSFGAYGLRRIYICEHCDAVHKLYEDGLKEYNEKFIAKHCKIKE
jgi:hypothetical protein